MHGAVSAHHPVSCNSTPWSHNGGMPDPGLAGARPSLQGRRHPTSDTRQRTDRPAGRAEGHASSSRCSKPQAAPLRRCKSFYRSGGPQRQSFRRGVTSKLRRTGPVSQKLGRSATRGRPERLIRPSGAPDGLPDNSPGQGCAATAALGENPRHPASFFVPVWRASCAPNRNEKRGNRFAPATQGGAALALGYYHIVPTGLQFRSLRSHRRASWLRHAAPKSREKQEREIPRCLKPMVRQTVHHRIKAGHTGYPSAGSPLHARKAPPG